LDPTVPLNLIPIFLDDLSTVTTSPFRTSFPSENSIRSAVRAMSENRGIILCDAGHPVRARDIFLRSVQVAAAASSRESVSAPSAEYCIAAGTASASIARERSDLAGLDGSNVSRAARFGSGGKAGNDSAVASGWVQGFLVLEISEEGWATERRL